MSPHRLLALLLLLSQTGIGLADTSPPGRLLVVSNGRTITPTILLEKIASADYLLIGELHDNPEHHRIENWLVRQLIDEQRLAGVAMEMVTPPQQNNIDQHHGKGLDQQTLGESLEWQENSSWPWNDYGSLIHQVIDSHHLLKAANLSRDEIRALYKEKSGHPLAAGINTTEAIRQKISKQLVESHCNEIEDDHLEAMLLIQQARDRRMASALLPLAAPDKTAVLVAGAYHVRKDIGAPRFMEGQEMLVLGLVEETDEDEARESWRHFDVVWITSSFGRPDYCAGQAN
jgi:uncharacterized iron-regulated protein